MVDIRDGGAEGATPQVAEPGWDEASHDAVRAG